MKNVNVSVDENPGDHSDGPEVKFEAPGNMEELHLVSIEILQKFEIGFKSQQVSAEAIP